MNAPRHIDGVICISPDEWADVKRPRQLMAKMSQRAPVVYVEPPLSLPGLIRMGTRALSGDVFARVRRAVTGRADRVSPGVSVVTPLGLFPEHRLSSIPFAPAREFVRRFAARSMSARACRAGREARVESPVLWVDHPVRLEPRLREYSSMLVYDCVDRWSGFPGPLNDPEWRTEISRTEGALTRGADVVFCSADGLYQSQRHVAQGQVELLRNAADFDHFTATGRPLPADIAGLPRPLVGYVGAIAEWVDIELIRATALARPEWTFVFVGPVFQGAISGQGSPERISTLPNVKLLGPRPYEDLPAYLEGFDVATIPFEISGLTEDTNPIKLYEYLAVGLPVVSTPLPEVLDIPGVRVARDAQEFVAQLEASLAERDDPQLVAARIRVAEENSWQARAQRAWSVVDAAPATPASTRAARPRVLAVATDLPWPLDSGYRIRAFENIRALSTFADVTLVCFAEKTSPAEVEQLRAALDGVEVLDPVALQIHIKHNLARVAAAALRGLLRGTPYKMSKFSSAKMARRLAEVTDAADFDALHVELATFQFVDGLRRRHAQRPFAVVLDQHNVESALLADHCSRGEFGWLTPAVAALECGRTRAYESRACAAADVVVTISEGDADAIRELTGGKAKVRTVAPVISAGEPADGAPRPAGESVLFVGQLSWLPNQEAIRWFCESVLPQVRKSHPDVRVDVVGGGASPEFTKWLAAAGVRPLGYVEDLGAAYDEARVAIAPFLTGGGVRIKLLEAMARGVPLVSTAVGAKGLRTVAGQDLLVADGASRFAEAVGELLDSEVRAREISASARRYLEAHHTRAAAQASLAEAYESVLPAERPADRARVPQVDPEAVTVPRGGAA